MKTALRILVVEDDKYFLQHLRDILAHHGTVDAAEDWPTAERLLAGTPYNVVVTDLHLDDGGEGLRVLDEARRQGALRLVLTSDQRDEVVAEAYARGAQHVLGKKLVAETLPAYLKSLLHQLHREAWEAALDERFPTKDSGLRESILRLLATPWQGRSLLLTGPTGTGKSALGKLLAELLHGDGAPFIHLNCSEIPDNLLESELFGHEKGAFTGADQRREGKLKLADGGVLFLDEVGTMSPAMQQKLLKAIDERTFFPVGAKRAVESRFTLVAATCEDLPRKIAGGLFREDLYFRLTGLTLRLPALSERRDDVEVLLRHFQRQFPRRFVVLPEALERLRSYPWPGNVREFRQAVQTLSEGNQGVVTARHVEALLGTGPAPSSGEAGLVGPEVRRYVAENGLRAYFQEVERQLAQEALERHQGKITSCIRELRISSSAFYRILQAHQILH